MEKIGDILALGVAKVALGFGALLAIAIPYYLLYQLAVWLF